MKKYTFLLLSGLTIFSYQIESAQLPAGSQDTEKNAKTEQAKIEAQWFEAVKSGDIEKIFNLSHLNVINAKDDTGQTALMIAASEGNIQVVELLLNTPFLNINLQNNDGWTALMFAITNGHYHIVRMILAAPGLKINLADREGNTALMCIGVCPDAEDILKLLLKTRYIDVNAKNNKGTTPLMFAAGRGSVNLVQQLLAHPEINVNIQANDGMNALICAVTNGHEEVVKCLLEIPTIDICAQTSTGANAATLAHAASIQRKSDLAYTNILALIEKKLEKMLETGETSLKRQELKKWFEAARSGDLETVKKMLSNLNARNNYKRTALMHASEKGHAEIVKLLLNTPGIDINAQSNTQDTALISATYNNKYEIVEMLLATPGIELNTQDQRGDTAFMYACAQSDRLMKLFVGKPGLDVNIKNNTGFTALMFAAKHGHVVVVEELLKMPNININLQDNNGLTALMLAVINNSQKIVELLIHMPGININAQDDRKDTALTLSRRVPMIRALIDSVINEQKRKAVVAIGNRDADAFAVVAAQIGIDAIVKCDILKTADKQQEEYVKSLLEKYIGAQDTAPHKNPELNTKPVAKKRKKSDDEIEIVKICPVCKTENCILQCSKCKSVYYCSDKCQKADWKNHKTKCKKQSR